MEEYFGEELDKMLASEGLELAKMSNNIKIAEVVEVIKVLAVIGKRTEDDPSRFEVQYWTKDGKLIGRGFR